MHFNIKNDDDDDDARGYGVCQIMTFVDRGVGVYKTQNKETSFMNRA